MSNIPLKHMIRDFHLHFGMQTSLFAKTYQPCSNVRVHLMQSARCLEHVTRIHTSFVIVLVVTEHLELIYFFSVLRPEVSKKLLNSTFPGEQWGTRVQEYERTLSNSGSNVSPSPPICLQAGLEPLIVHLEGPLTYPAAKCCWIQALTYEGKLNLP